jgi:hypothetical protein
MVLPHFRVHDLFYPVQLPGFRRSKVRKIESQTVLGDEGTRLVHVFAEDGTKCRVQEVCRGVMSGDRQSPVSVDLGRDLRLRDALGIARDQSAPVEDSTLHAHGILYDDLEAFTADTAGVPHLPTGFGVERCHVKHQV